MVPSYAMNTNGLAEETIDPIPKHQEMALDASPTSTTSSTEKRKCLVKYPADMMHSGSNVDPKHVERALKRIESGKPVPLKVDDKTRRADGRYRLLRKTSLKLKSFIKSCSFTKRSSRCRVQNEEPSQKNARNRPSSTRPAGTNAWRQWSASFRLSQKNNAPSSRQEKRPLSSSLKLPGEKLKDNTRSKSLRILSPQERMNNNRWHSSSSSSTRTLPVAAMNRWDSQSSLATTCRQLSYNNNNDANGSYRRIIIDESAFSLQAEVTNPTKKQSPKTVSADIMPKIPRRLYSDEDNDTSFSQ